MGRELAARNRAARFPASRRVALLYGLSRAARPLGGAAGERRNTVSRGLRRLLLVLVMSATANELHAQRRFLQPEDLFRLERVGTIAWSPDWSRAAVEIHRPTRWLDSSIPTADIAVVDVASATLRVISSSSAEIVGFFRPVWSPDNRRLLFLSVDSNAVVRPWLWTVDAGPPTRFTGLELHDGLADPPVGMWSDAEHVVFMTRDAARPNEGPLYSRIQRARNVADQWARARDGREPAVSVFDSHGAASGSTMADGTTRQSRIVSVDARTQMVTTIATGALHRPTLSLDGRTLTYRTENPPFPLASVASFFGPKARGEAAFDDVNWGSEIHHVDVRTGMETSAPKTSAPTPPPTGRPALRVTNTATEATRILLTRLGQSDIELWQGNSWVREIETGRAEAINYQSTSGTPLTGWLLYPPGYVAGRRIPILTIVYPGTVYNDRAPSTLDIFNAQFEHPQLFAALGYGVVLPSMPGFENPLQSEGLGGLTTGVLPLIDTLVEREVADSSRIAVLGQSAGGWATLGLLAETNRFRTAIVSAGYSNLVSLYGTFYGQYRYGDGGSAPRAQVLRMLQFERGYYGADAPPWEQPERYRVNSPIWRVADVRTPVLLVHGDADFVPVQQAEEFFTALYRQDKRVRLVRYAGEQHTITARANVLDLWRRMTDWLRETMPSNQAAR